MEFERVSIRAACANQNKHFKLDLPLFKAINVTNSTWSMTSVGRGSFTLSKLKLANKWSRLLQQKDRPKNMHIWWAMQAQFDDALEALGDDEENNSKQSQKPGPTTTTTTTTKEEDSAAKTDSSGTPPESDLDVAFKKAKKNLESALKRARKAVESQSTQKKADLQKQIDAIEADDAKQLSALESNHKSQLLRLEQKLASLKSQREKQGDGIVWTDDEDQASEESFFGHFVKTVKDFLQPSSSPKQEV